MYITIVRSNYYMGVESYKIGQRLYLEKDKDNSFDEESIKVVSGNGAIYGYVANSVCSVARGSHSAGYIYNMFDSKVPIIVCFIIEDKVIAKIEFKEEKII